MEQKRWELKRDVYTDLLQRFNRLALILAEIVPLLQSNKPLTSELVSQHQATLDGIIPVISVAQIFVSDEAVVVFGEWAVGIMKAGDLSDLILPQNRGR